MFLCYKTDCSIRVSNVVHFPMTFLHQIAHGMIYSGIESLKYIYTAQLLVHIGDRGGKRVGGNLQLGGESYENILFGGLRVWPPGF